MRRTHTSHDTTDTVATDGGPSAPGFAAAYRQLVDARTRYEAYRGDSQHIRELSAARFALEDARRELAYVRLQAHTV